jgi:hypothetical protein
MLHVPDDKAHKIVVLHWPLLLERQRRRQAVLRREEATESE